MTLLIHQQLASLATAVHAAPVSAARSIAPGPSSAVTANAVKNAFVPFFSGGMDQFPYYYLDPATLLFNTLTYNWINASLVNNNPPILQGSGLFTNYFLTALSKVT
ncbi:MAG TPA: hypothetical protein VD772_08140, partial [Anseongella sp.]|nr:hypothetical protein [Anseongella sp.]